MVKFYFTAPGLCAAAPVGLKPPKLMRGYRSALLFWISALVEASAQSMQSMYSYPEWNKWGHSRSTRRTRSTPGSGFTICAYVHMCTYTSPSSELIWPVALEGGEGLPVKPEGKWRSATPHGDGSPSVLVTWEPSGWFSFISNHKEPSPSAANFTDSPIPHNGHFVDLHAPLTWRQLADVLPCGSPWTQQF